MAVTGRLLERDLSFMRGSCHRAMVAAGGLWFAAHPSIKDREVIAEAKARGVRALQIEEPSELLVQELPDLEFLGVGAVEPDVRSIASLKRLRSLSFSASWRGRLDLSALAHLEWLGVGECEPGNLDSLVPGHPSLRQLSVGRYPFADLTPLGRLQLRRLNVGNSRRLKSLDGAASLAPTLVGLDLWMLPALGSLDGIEALANLEVLELAGLRQITTLDWVQRLPRLRLLNVFDLKNVESLGPLAGHPSLEFVTFGRTKDLDLEPLASIPNLRLIHTGSYWWNRDVHEFPYLHDFPWDHQLHQEYLGLLHG